MRLPIATGIHAAASGDNNSDLLMSSVILDNTNKRKPAEMPLGWTQWLDRFALTCGYTPRS